MPLRLTKRPGVLALSGFAALALAVAFLAFHAGGAKASGGASYAGTRGIVTRTGNTTSVPRGVQTNLANFACLNMTDLPIPQGCDAAGDDAAPTPNSPFNGGPKGAKHGNGPNAPNNGRSGAGALLTNINGVNDDDNVAEIDGHVTPPDQGLCVGAAGPLETAGLPLGVSGNTSVVIEAVNDSWAVYSTSGAKLFGADGLADLFSDPFASGDVSCNYDPATQTFFFTEIGGLLSGPDAGNVATDLAVISPAGYTPYQVDTSVGGNCFPDFPQQGFNDNTFNITIDEFCGPQEDFAGTNLYTLSKSQLTSLSPSVNVVSFGPLFLDGDPVLGLRPAIGDGTSTEYLVNSVAYDAAGNPVNSNSLGFWQLTGGQNVTSGSGTVTLSGRSIVSEPYGFPVPATSTGNNTCVSIHNGICILSEPVLNPDDSRLEQLQYVSGSGGPARLYTSLDTSLTVGSDPTVVDGAAWFDINPSNGNINHEGYVAVAGTNLLYPSIVRANSGTLMMGLSMTSPTLNPSTGYALSKNEGNGFSPVQSTGVGSGPHISFSDFLPGALEPRWGDYSAIAFDPSNGNVWMADEYVPPADQGGADPVDNWGTRVWELAP